MIKPPKAIPNSTFMFGIQSRDCTNHLMLMYNFNSRDVGIATLVIVNNSSVFSKF